MNWSKFFLGGFLLGTLYYAQAQIPIPMGKPVMINGQFTSGEWDDAYFIPVNDTVTIFLKQTEEYVHIGIQHLTVHPKGGWADMYISDAHETFNLHASRKLGERKLRGMAWPDWTEWWNNAESWTANFTRHDDKRTESKSMVVPLPDSGWEFQIRKSKFTNNHWKLMFEISLYQENGYKTIIYPANTTNTKTTDWLIVNLNNKAK